MSKSLHLVHLYPEEMNIYGDTGNRLVLQKRLEWRGVETKLSFVGIGDELPDDSDIIIGGGGQDAVQSAIQIDILKKAGGLKALRDDSVVMLMVCGLYQLFGRRFITTKAEEIKGIGVLPLETRAGQTRLIGNIIVKSPWGKLVGYENHSGQTFLDEGLSSIGKVIKGAGNNGQDKREGAVLNNVFGTYLHGPILSKNPDLADELIRRALQRKYDVEELKPLDNNLEKRAASIAQKRPR